MTAAIVYGFASAVLGSVPFALLLGLTRGIDIRRCGSGNPGATNLARNLGVGWGVAAFVLDAAKGWAPVFCAPLLLENPGAGWCLSFGVAAILGHCFSPFLHFKGGKGVATAAGALTALAPWISLILLGVWGAALALLRTVGIASCVAAVAGIGAGAWRMVRSDNVGDPVPWLLFVAGSLIIYRHRTNIRSYFQPAAKAE